MKRREALITGLATVASGCITGSTDTSRNRSAPEEYQRRVAIVNQDTVPDTYSVGIDAELIERYVTKAHTAKMEVELTNNGKPRQFSVRSGRCFIFNRRRGLSDPPGVLLLRPSEGEYVTRDGDKWTRDRAAEQLRGWPSYACGDKTYIPQESVKQTYELWDDYQVDGYMKPGTYRFEAEITIEDGEEQSTFTWGFDVRISS